MLLRADTGGETGSPGLIRRARLGLMPQEAEAGAPYDLWLHGVSVGEQMVLEPIVAALLERAPGLNIAVSSFTETGYRRAKELFGGRCRVIGYPLDFPQAVKRALDSLRPRLYACVETELWPNMLLELDRRGTPRVLLNARISPRSFPRYMKVRPLVRRMLAGFKRICAISQENRQRLVALGALESAIQVSGNAKYQGLLSKTADGEETGRIRARMKRLLMGPDQREETGRIWICGSIRGREHQHIIRAFSVMKDAFPALRLVLAPRHLERVSDIEGVLRAEGIGYGLWSRIKGRGLKADERVAVVDEMGCLFEIYSAASFSFVGGSIEPLGGQNPMEPAAWSSPVIYGPHMENFEDAVRALEARKGGIRLDGPGPLAKVAAFMLENEEFAKEAGARARLALEDLAQGAADRQAEALLELLGPGA